MKLYLDDLRSAPPGWQRTHTAEETIDLLRTGEVEELSLDYNLGPDSSQTGAAVPRWIDQKIASDPDWTPPKRIRVHSTHRVGRAQLVELLKGIRRRLLEQGRTAPELDW